MYAKVTNRFIWPVRGLRSSIVNMHNSVPLQTSRIKVRLLIRVLTTGKTIPVMISCIDLNRPRFKEPRDTPTLGFRELGIRRVCAVLVVVAHELRDKGDVDVVRQFIFGHCDGAVPF